MVAEEVEILVGLDQVEAQEVIEQEILDLLEILHMI